VRRLERNSAKCPARFARLNQTRAAMPPGRFAVKLRVKSKT